MSRIGNKTIQVPESVQVEITNGSLKATGPKGEMAFEVPGKIKVTKEGQVLQVARLNNDKESKSLHGLWRMLIYNAITGVDKGWERKLDFKGVGFRAEVQENKLILNVGFSHPVEIVAPEGISFGVTKNIITVSGIDKQVVGQVAANIRKVRPVEPYKQKGIKYIEEIPRKKLGKAAKAATAPGA